MNGYAIDLSPLFPYINEFVGLVLTGAAGWAVKELAQFLASHKLLNDQQTDALLVSAFSRALQNGMAIAQTKLNSVEKQNSTLSVNDWLSKEAGQYALDHSPDYVARFLGAKTPDEAIQHAANKALAYLPAIK